MPELLSEVEFYSPRTLSEALRLRAELGDRLRVVAGGTDAMVWQEQRRFPLPEAYLSLWGVRELSYVQRTGQVLRIGPLTTYSSLMASAELQHHFPCLCEASRQVGALQIQNRGTLGGNIVNASPAGDTLPVLAVSNAVLVLESASRGRRRVPFDGFYTGYRQTVLASDELLVEVELPVPPVGSLSQFAKVGSRRAQTISKVMAAIRATFDDAGRITQVALAYGSVAPVVVRVPHTEALLLGRRPETVSLPALEATLRSEITPISDLRSTADYRSFAAMGLLKRFLRAWSVGRPRA